MADICSIPPTKRSPVSMRAGKVMSAMLLTRDSTVGTTGRDNSSLQLLGFNGGHLHYPADEARDRSYMGVLLRPYGVFATPRRPGKPC